MCFICVWPESKVINHRYWVIWEFYLLQEGSRTRTARVWELLADIVLEVQSLFDSHSL